MLEKGFAMGLLHMLLLLVVKCAGTEDDKLIRSAEFFGEDGGGPGDDTDVGAGGTDVGDDLPLPLPLATPDLFSIVFTVTVVPAGIFLVRLSALLAASDKLLLLLAALAKLLL
jgi:hypothetical protein